MKKRNGWPVRVLSVLLFFIMISQTSVFAVNPSTYSTGASSVLFVNFNIARTDAKGNIITDKYLKPGEDFYATVYLKDIMRLRTASIQLTFDPDVVELVNSKGKAVTYDDSTLPILPEGSPSDAELLDDPTYGVAFTPSDWPTRDPSNPDQEGGFDPLESSDYGYIRIYKGQIIYSVLAVNQFEEELNRTWSYSFADPYTGQAKAKVDMLRLHFRMKQDGPGGDARIKFMDDPGDYGYDPDQEPIGGAVAIADANTDKYATRVTKTVFPFVQKIPVSSVSITQPTEHRILTETQVQFQAEVLPANATNKTVTWKLENVTSANGYPCLMFDDDQTGSQTGLIRGGFSPGTATVVAEVDDDGDIIRAEFPVTVEHPTAVESFTVAESELTIPFGTEVNLYDLLHITCEPQNADISPRTLRFDYGYTIRDMADYYYELNKGTGTLRASDFATGDDPDNIVVLHRAGVEPYDSEGNLINGSHEIRLYFVDEITNIIPEKKSMTLSLNETATNSLSFDNIADEAKPEDKTLSASIDNPAVAEVHIENRTLSVKALSYGEATVTVRLVHKPEVSVQIPITVARPADKPVTKVTITNKPQNDEIEREQSVQLGVVLTPADSTDVNQTVYWTVSPQDAATVDATGKVTALANAAANGELTVTATYAGDSTIKDSYTLTVKVPVEQIMISDCPAAMQVGEKVTPTISVLPADTTDSKDYGWTVTGSAVEVNEATGEITAVAEGTADVQVYSKVNGNIVDSVTITVSPSDVIAITDFDVANLESTMNVEVGYHVVPTVTYQPEEHTMAEGLTWSIVSAEPSDAVTLDEATGELTAVKAGKAVIRAALTADPSLTKSFTISIKEKTIDFTNITITDVPETLYVGEKASLGIMYTPENGTADSSITWSVEGATITIDEQGTITGKAAGTSIVHAVLAGGKVRAQVEITVRQPAESVRISGERTVEMGHVLQLGAVFTPETAYNKTAVWSVVEGNDVLSIDPATGAVTPLKTGSAKVRAAWSGNNAVYDEAEITVVQPIRSISVSVENQTMARGSKQTASVTVEPADATGSREVDWTATALDGGETDVLSVDAAGVITAKAIGTAKVVATLKNGTIYGEAVITVDAPLTALNIVGLEQTMKRGTEKQASVEYLPEDTTTELGVTWSVKEGLDAAVTVSDSGLVQAVKNGTATVVATSNALNSVVGEFVVTVHAPIERIEITAPTTLERDGEAQQAEVVYYPENPTGSKDIRWSIKESNGAITVTEDGLVSAHTITSEDVTATLVATLKENSEITAERVITVKASLKELLINGAPQTMNRNDTVTITPGYLPADTTSDRAVAWSVGEDSILKVTEEDGVTKLTAVGKGTTTLTVTSAEEPTIFKTINITVVAPVETIAITGLTDTMARGKTAQAALEITPADADNVPEVEWRIVDATDEVLSVAADGMVTAVGIGTASVLATLKGTDISAKYTITVNVPLESISINESTLPSVMNVGDSAQVSVLYNPQDTTDAKDIKWQAVSSDGGSVSVVPSSDGSASIFANLPGTITLKAVSTVNAELVAEKTFTVIIPIDNIEITAGTDENNQAIAPKTVMDIDTSQQLYGVVLPDTATVSKQVRWSVTEGTAVEISETGLVTAREKGRATIRATSVYDDTKYKELVIDVRVPLKSVRLTVDKTSLSKGESTLVRLILEPEDASISKDARFVIENPIGIENIVTLVKDEAGEGNTATLTAVSGGTTTIRAYLTENEEWSASADIEVVVPLIDVGFSGMKESVLLKNGNPQNGIAAMIFNPADTTIDRTVVWTSSDSEVIAINEATGEYTILKPGTATITGVLQSDPTKVVTRSVTVDIPLNQMHIVDVPEKLEKGDIVQGRIVFEPENATLRPNITWESSNPNVVQVVDGATGKLEAVGGGSAMITAKVEGDITGELETSVMVTVEVPLKQISLTAIPPQMEKNDQLTFKVAFTPMDTTVSHEMQWEIESEQENVVDIRPLTNENGIVVPDTYVITGLSGGSATVKAVVKEQPETLRSFPMTVNVSLNSLKITNLPERLIKNQTADLGVVYDPEDTTVDRAVTWEVIPADSEIFTVNADGQLTAKKGGTAKVRVSLNSNPEIGAERTVNVVVPLERVELYTPTSLGADGLIINVNDEPVQLEYTLFPEDTTETDVMFAIADGSPVDIVYVNPETGMVVPLKGGMTSVVVKKPTANEPLPTGRRAAALNDEPTQETISDPIPVSVISDLEGFVLTEDEIHIAKGESTEAALEYKTVPEGATENLETEWISNNPEIATIDKETGIITGVSQGNTTIILRSKNRPDILDTATVYVDVALESLVIDGEDSIDLGLNAAATLAFHYVPADTSQIGAKWESSDPAIIQIVDADKGIIKAVGGGSATVTVKSTVDDTKFDSVTVNVQSRATAITLAQETLALNKAPETEVEAIGLTFEPSTATDKAVQWSSSNEKVVTVDKQTGKIKAVGPGTANIYVELVSNTSVRAVCAVTVSVPLESIALNPAGPVALGKGESATLKVVYTPADTTEREVTFSSSNDTLLKVTKLSDDTVRVTALDGPSATVTATAAKEGVEAAEAVVNIAVQPDSITILDEDKANISMNKGATRTLSVQVLPATTSDQTLVWSSSNPAVVSVDETTGEMTAKGGGTATITVKSKADPMLVQTALVTVIVPLEGLAISVPEDGLTMDKGKTKQLSVIYTPADTTQRAVTWESDDGTMVEITDAANGIIKAIEGPGTTITVKSAVEGVEISSEPVQVDVSVGVGSINITTASFTMKSTDAPKQLEYTILPANATVKDLEWTVYPENIFTVSDTGVVSLIKDEDGNVKTGTVSVFAKSKDGTISSNTITIQVEVMPESIRFAEDTVHLNIGDRYRPVPIFAPANTSDQSITYISSDTSKVNVVDGLLVASAPTVTGEGDEETEAGVTITAVSKADGTVQGTFKAVVKKALVPKIVIEPPSEMVYDGDLFEVLLRVTNTDVLDSAAFSILYDSTKMRLVNESGEFSDNSAEYSTLLNSNYKLLRASRTKLADEQMLLKYDIVVNDTLRDKLGSTSYPDNQVDLVRFRFKAIEAGKPVIHLAENGEDRYNPNGYMIYNMVRDDAVYVPHKVEQVTADMPTDFTIYATLKSISFEEESVTINKGETGSQAVIYDPEDATQTEVEWKSSNEEYATVGADGVVTAHKVNGDTIVTITATAKYGLELQEKALAAGEEFDMTPYTASYTVIIKSPLTGVDIEEEALTIDRGGEPGQVTVKLIPEDATDTTISWSFDREGIIAIDETGKVTTVSPTAKGDVVATVTATSGDVSFTKDITITVNVPVTGVSIADSEGADAGESITIDKGGAGTPLQAIIEPEDATNPNVTWESSNPSAVTVVDGVITAVDAGSATITVTTEDGSFTDTIEVTVNVPVTGLTITDSDGNLTESVTMTRAGEAGDVIGSLKAVVTPSNATSPEVTWSIEGIDGAAGIEIDESGNIKLTDPTAKGSFTVTATNKAYPDIQDTITVVIDVPVESIDITLEDESVTETVAIDKGATKVFGVAFLPADASNQDVVWSTGDSTIATVAEDGTVTGVAKGETTLTVTSVADPSISDTVSIKIVARVTGVDIFETEVTVIRGEAPTDNQLTWEILPADADNQEISWKVQKVGEGGALSDTNEVSVNENGGIVTGATAKGEYVATITTADNTMTDTVKIKVSVPVESASITPMDGVTVTVDGEEKAGIRVENGSTYQPELVINPEDYSKEDAVIVWSSANPSVAAVDPATGKVTAVMKGITSITATITSNGKEIVTSIPFEVKISVTNVKVEPETLTIGVGVVYNKTVGIVEPFNANNLKLHWSSSNNEVATVDEQGVITAVSAGTVTITATSDENAAISDSLTVHVVAYTISGHVDLLTRTARNTAEAADVSAALYKKDDSGAYQLVTDAVAKINLPENAAANKDYTAEFVFTGTFDGTYRVELTAKGFVLRQIDNIVMKSVDGQCVALSSKDVPLRLISGNVQATEDAEIADSVHVGDYSAFMPLYNTDSTGDSYTLAADFTGDGIIGFDDLVYIYQNWNKFTGTYLAQEPAVNMQYSTPVIVGDTEKEPVPGPDPTPEGE